MKLIVGLGNPEPRYELTRHNIGFLLLDHIAAHFGVGWQEKSKLKADVAEIAIGEQKALLLKPTTYYNLSGEAARAAVDFYKLAPARDVLVLHDELALPFGTLRARLDGSDAGNNGIKSLSAHLGPEFARVRVGIANADSPERDAADFVLGRLTNDEQRQLDRIAAHTLGFVEDFVHQQKDFTPTSVRINPNE